MLILRIVIFRCIPICMQSWWAFIDVVATNKLRILIVKTGWVQHFSQNFMLIDHELPFIHVHFRYVNILISHELPTIRVWALLLIEYVLDLKRHLILFIIPTSIACDVLVVLALFVFLSSFIQHLFELQELWIYLQFGWAWLIVFVDKQEIRNLRTLLNFTDPGFGQYWCESLWVSNDWWLALNLGFFITLLLLWLFLVHLVQASIKCLWCLCDLPWILPWCYLNTW